MRNYIILNGTNSNTIPGLLISSLPSISKPLIRTTIEEIDGRDGDIVTKLGYAAYDKTFEIGLYGSYDINQVITYFNSEGTVIFSNEPTKYYKYQILEQIDFERLIRYKTATVTMHAQPFKFLVGEDPVVKEAASITGEGTEITLNNTVEVPFASFEVKGKTVQDGTPAPDNSIEIENVDSIEIEVTDENNTQSQTVSFPLEEGQKLYEGSYLAADGIHNLKRQSILNSSTLYGFYSSYTNLNIVSVLKKTDDIKYGNVTRNKSILCNKLKYSTRPNGYDDTGLIDKIYDGGDLIYLIGLPKTITSLEEAQTYLGNITVEYELATEEVIPYTTEQQAAYNEILNLNSYNGTTNINSTGDLPAILNVSVYGDNTTTITNSGNIVAKPKFTIYGVGNIGVSLNSQQLFQIALGDEELISIDIANMEAYNPETGALKNRLVTGDYSNFKLNPGTNTLSFTGIVSKVEVSNYSRWL